MDRSLDISDVSNAEESRFYKMSNRKLSCFGSLQPGDGESETLDGTLKFDGEDMLGCWVFHPRQRRVFRQDSEADENGVMRGVLVYEENRQLRKFVGEVQDWVPQGKGLMVSFMSVSEGKFLDGRLVEGTITRNGKTIERRKLEPAREKDGAAVFEGYRHTSKAFILRGKFSPLDLSTLSAQVCKTTKEEKEAFEPPK